MSDVITGVSDSITESLINHACMFMDVFLYFITAIFIVRFKYKCNVAVHISIKGFILLDETQRIAIRLMLSSCVCVCVCLCVCVSVCLSVYAAFVDLRKTG